MPDITMCSGVKCPRKSECYRCVATPTPRVQSYFCSPPIEADGSCRYFAALRARPGKR